MVSFIGIAAMMALIGGSVGYFTFPMGLTFGIKSAINLAENGPVYPLYMNPPFPTRSTFHLFAVKNPREVLQGARMSFEMKGPYEFDAWLRRDDIEFVKQGEKVRFDTGRLLVPQESRSANFDEKMYLLNPILPSTARTVRSMVIDRVPFRRLTEPIVFNAVNLLLDQYKERLLMRTTPRAILMGRKVELLESLSGLATRFGLQTLIPPGPPENTFGLAFVQNKTLDRMELWTGTGSSKGKFAELAKWRGKSALDIWSGSSCNTIEGTNGELFKPLIEENTPIRVFLGPLCRSFNLEPTTNGDQQGAGATTIMTKAGIRAYEYEISPRLYLGSRNNPANKCFCENPRSYDCMYDGLITMGPCFFDSPLFFSRGNLMNVDERIKRTIDYRSIVGSDATQPLLPEKQSFALEPITGTVLEVNLTLMALFKVSRQSYMRDLANLRNLTYAPLFAATEQVAVPFKFVWQIYALQTLDDYHKPLMAGTALTGLGILGFKFLFGV